MKGRFAEELYAESLQLSKLELRPTSADDQENKIHGKIQYGWIDMETPLLNALNGLVYKGYDNE